MSDKPELRALRRADTGKSAARALRRAGRLPVVVYGGGRPSEALSVDAREVETLLSGVQRATTVISLKVERRKPRQVLIREVQSEPDRADLLHLDLLAVSESDTVRVQVPIRLEDTPAGVKLGGILQQARHEVTVECLPGDIPPEVKVSVSHLEIGSGIHVSDLDLPGVTILDDPAMTVCTVVPPALEEEPEEVEEVEVEEGEEAEEAEDESD
ncbi:MAG: 50S ribosomal protein L25 [Gemmatimonadetes bacterium]|nr:50S ribosomal protein L25 [Gemmatimonadota bacterium]